MKIVVCVKQVPDTAAKIVAAGGDVTWGEAPLVLNPWDEYAVELALQLGGDVTALTVGQEGPNEALKQALAMGCGEAVLVSDPALSGADSQAIARVLAGAVSKIGAVDLLVFGRQAVDDDGGVMAAQVARVLGWPCLSLAASVQVEDGTVRTERAIEEGRQVLSARLPAVISVTKDIGEPRYPSFMGIRKASRAQIPTWTLGDIGIEAPAPALSFLETFNPPTVEVEVEMIAGESPEAIAASLADRLIAEKVL